MNLTCKFCPLSFLFSKKKKRDRILHFLLRKSGLPLGRPGPSLFSYSGTGTLLPPPPLLLCIYATLDSPSLLSYSSCFLYELEKTWTWPWNCVLVSCVLLDLQASFSSRWVEHESQATVLTRGEHRRPGMGALALDLLHLSHTHGVAVGHCSLLDSSM